MKKCTIFRYFDESMTDGRTDRQTNGQTGRPSYRDMRSNLTSARGHNDASSSVFSNFSNFSNFFFELLCIWAGLKHFYSHFRSGFTIIYGENYAFLSLFTKALWTDQRTNGWTDGPTDGHILL